MYLIIDGQMKLIHSFGAPPPALGRIQGKLPVSMASIHSPGPDSVDVRLAGLLGDLNQQYVWTKTTRPRKAVAAGNAKTRNVLDGRFFGPLPDDQIENYEQLLACLVKMPCFRVPEADARKLLKNPNPFLVWLGALRLGDSQDEKLRIRDADYFTAMRALPPAFLGGMADAMFLDFSDPAKTANPEFRAAALKEILAFLRETDAPHQLALLASLNEALADSVCNVKEWLRPEKEFVDGIERLVQERQDIKPWRGTVGEYRKLLRLLKKP
jgi:hypothetical protein